MSTDNRSTQTQTWSEWVPMHQAHLEASVPDELLLALLRRRDRDFVEHLTVVVHDLVDRGQLRIRTACPICGDPACGGRYSNTIEASWPVTEVLP
jgi:hypothetical protein